MCGAGKWGAAVDESPCPCDDAGRDGCDYAYVEYDFDVGSPCVDVVDE